MIRCLSIVSYRFLPPETGGQRLIGLFHRYLAFHWEVTCVSTADNSVAAAEGYAVLPVLGKGAMRYINPFTLFRLRRIIRERQITHLLLEHPYLGWLGVSLKWLCGVKLIVHSHNIEGNRWRSLGKWWWRILWAYEGWVHRQAARNLFVQDDDREYAITHWSLQPGRCLTVTYGLDRDSAPDPAIIRAAREQIRRQYGIPAGKTVLCFNGAFNYPPNRDALRAILDEILPLLDERGDLDYTLLVCGKDIPAEWRQKGYARVIFAGFVPEITPYLLASDVFLNPVVRGGGIKTKLVEALGANLNAVSVRSGAVGVDPAWCNGKLLIGEDGDWSAFARLVVEASRIDATIPPVYFEHFYWGSIVNAAAAFME